MQHALFRGSSGLSLRSPQLAYTPSCRSTIGCSVQSAWDEILALATDTSEGGGVETPSGGEPPDGAAVRLHTLELMAVVLECAAPLIGAVHHRLARR